MCDDDDDDKHDDDDDYDSGDEVYVYRLTFWVPSHTAQGTRCMCMCMIMAQGTRCMCTPTRALGLQTGPTITSPNS